MMHDVEILFLQGAFAFEDAMLRGAPLEEEVEFLIQAGGGNDELIDIALQSLPEDALTKGIMTQLQLERMVRHFLFKKRRKSFCDSVFHVIICVGDNLLLGDTIIPSPSHL